LNAGQIQRWRRQHERGALRYLLLDGALLYGLGFFAVGFYALGHVPRAGRTGLNTAILLVVCPTLGMLCAWLEWRRNERHYRQAAGR
jgi:hypothetical protein